jgi:hypothetical protein
MYSRPTEAGGGTALARESTLKLSLVPSLAIAALARAHERVPLDLTSASPLPAYRNEEIASRMRWRCPFFTMSRLTTSRKMRATKS